MHANEILIIKYFNVRRPGLVEIESCLRPSRSKSRSRMRVRKENGSRRRIKVENLIDIRQEEKLDLLLKFKLSTTIVDETVTVIQPAPLHLNEKNQWSKNIDASEKINTLILVLFDSNITPNIHSKEQAL